MLGQLTVPRRRDDVIDQIRSRLAERGQTLADAIRERELYFRISVVGTCNLSCTFCHNEGAPASGKISLGVVGEAVPAAVRAGFTRVQFTGGEPLLRPDIGDFVRLAREHVDDVGVTTNGTYLPQRLEALLDAGLARMHVSLQTEPLVEAGTKDAWGIPDWLMPTVERAASGAFTLRLNLPVPADSLDRTEAFLYLLTARGVNVKVFSVLPEGEVREDSYPLAALNALVDRVNAHNSTVPGAGEVLLRGFRPPAGIRCSTCGDLPRCKEQSHSLRLGADLLLRPCLATRTWDAPLQRDHIDASVTEAALLALDYAW
ncbi:radical SAM protein [Wenjunlia vitaminophila]|nr:radical SAM protein [Wenjunlia vitaminophila]